MHGVVDRIDQHEDGRIRVLDYKTFEKSKKPDDEHLKNAPKTSAENEMEPVPEFRLCDVNGKKKVWQDLQLPLYCLLLRPEFGSVCECGYFGLPKAVTETRVEPWKNLSLELLASAETCARGVVEAILNRDFWPPTEKMRYDDFDRILFKNAAESVCWPASNKQ